MSDSGPFKLRHMPATPMTQAEMLAQQRAVTELLDLMESLGIDAYELEDGCAQA